MRRHIGKIVFSGAFLASFAANAATSAHVQAPGGGAVRALVVGVNLYYRMPAAQLHGAVADARDIAQALAKAGVATTPILDKDATRPRVVQELNQLVAQSKPGDLVIISFAGHGMKVPEYERWKGIEAGGVNEQIAFSGFEFKGAGAGDVLVNKELKAYLSRLDAKGVDVLVAMDSCFGGGMSRKIDARGGAWPARGVDGSFDKADLARFAPIDMTQAEARAEVRAMSHVTFLSGASKDAVVPEIDDLEPSSGPRGALSYFFARAIEGASSQGADVTRQALVDYVRQNVKQRSNDRQDVAFEPRTDDAGARSRAVLHFGEPVAPPKSPQDMTDARLQNPIRVAAINGTADASAAIARGKAPFEPAASPQAADLVWDVRAGDALERGDLVTHNVDGSLIGGVIDRTWAIHAIRVLSEPRVLQIGLAEGGKLYAPGDSPQFVASGLRDSYLTVFNIAADGEIQMLFPTDGRDPHLLDDKWEFRPLVEKPFGADQVVAVMTARPATQLVAWLNEHNHKRDAALAPAQIVQLLKTDPALKIGAVGLYTASSRN